ncbi:MAG: flagellar hook-length control protein FliK [Deltaproteobacteria bacterium]|nr:flagellar hook-length control protein FliK [Deltaproteobacteria bacterium]
MFFFALLAVDRCSLLAARTLGARGIVLAPSRLLMVTIPALVLLDPHEDLSGASVRSDSLAEAGTDFFSLFLALSAQGGQGLALLSQEQSTDGKREPAPASDEPSRPDALPFGQGEILPFVFPLLLAGTPGVGETLPVQQGGDLEVSSLPVNRPQPVLSTSDPHPLLSTGAGLLSLLALPDGPQLVDSSQLVEQQLLPSLPDVVVADPAPPTGGVQSQPVEQPALPAFPRLQAQHAEKEGSAAKLLFQGTEQPQVSTDRTVGSPVADTPLLPSTETAPSVVSSLVPLAEANVQSRGLSERKGLAAEQGEGPTAADDTNGFSSVPPPRLVEVNGKTDGRSLAFGDYGRPSAEKREAMLSLSPHMSAGEKRVLGDLALGRQQAAGTTPHFSETWQSVLDQVTSGISASLRRNSQEARIQLEPPELGRLNIDLVLEGGRVHARIVAESADVGVLIQTHLPELRHALQSHSLDLEEVRVDVQGGGGERGNFSPGFQQDSEARGQEGTIARPQWARKEGEEPDGTLPPGRTRGVSVWA